MEEELMGFEQIQVKKFGIEYIFVALHIKTNIVIQVVVDNDPDSFKILNRQSIQKELDSWQIEKRTELYEDVIKLKLELEKRIKEN